MTDKQEQNDWIAEKMGREATRLGQVLWKGTALIGFTGRGLSPIVPNTRANWLATHAVYRHAANFALGC